MNFEEVVGQKALKKELNQMIENQMIPHALFFLGSEGFGSMALALEFSKALLADFGNQTNLEKTGKLDHPDFYFIAPNSIDKKNQSYNWRNFLKENPYLDLFQWFDFIKIDNKQAQIGVEAIESIFYLTQLKPYKAGRRIILLWKPERLTLPAANKLLKILEEPPAQTIFLFVGENKKEVLPTIKSRLQLMEIGPIQKEEIAKKLINKFQIEKIEAENISQKSNGNWKKVLEIIQNKSQEFEEIFISWLRSIFLIKKNKVFFKELLDFSHQLASWGREKQKEFLLFSLEIIRKAFLASHQINYKENPFSLKEFRWENFHIFIHKENIKLIYKKLNDSINKIEKNANSKMIFFDLSIKLSKNLNKK